MSDAVFLRKHDDIEGVLSPSQNNIIFGHEEVRQFLAQMRREERLHHALLFEGERGIGKATLAFQFSWNIFSNQKGEFLQPDQNSIIWNQITQGSYPGLLHISRHFDSKTKKFKTGITIDDIRSVMHFLNQTSQDGGWRIVIIDSADDMNKNAANAILKTLEEPPKKTLFILITHSLGKLLPTIRSRCQHVSLRPLGNDEMKQAILNVLPNQILTDIEIEKIVKKSQGSLRKAALLLCCGGLEIVRALDDLLKNSICNPAIAHNLAQTLSSSDADIQFKQFCDEALDTVQKRAIILASNGALSLSKQCAQAWQDIHQEILEMQSFNLDKKQFVINLIFRIHKIIHEYKLFP